MRRHFGGIAKATAKLRPLTTKSFIIHSDGYKASPPSSRCTIHAQGVKSWGGRFIGREFCLVTQGMAGPSVAVYGCSNTSSGFNAVLSLKPQCDRNRTFTLFHRASHCTAGAVCTTVLGCCKQYLQMMWRDSNTGPEVNQYLYFNQ